MEIQMPKSQKTRVKCAHASLPADQHIAAEYLCICEADGVRREKDHRMWKCVIHMWTLWFMWLKRCSLVYNFKFTCDVFFFLHFQIQSSHLRKYMCENVGFTWLTKISSLFFTLQLKIVHIGKYSIHIWKCGNFTWFCVPCENRHIQFTCGNILFM